MRLRQFREHIRDWRTLGALALCAGAVSAVFCLAPSTTPAAANVHTALVAQPATTTPALRPSTASQSGGCTLGTIPLDALTCSGPVRYFDTVVTDAAQAQAGTALTGTWQDLANNPDLDIQAEAWCIAYLDQQLPTTWPSAYGENELLAMMYSGGAANLLPVVQGTQTPGTDAQGCLDNVQGNWDYIDQLICRSSACTCSR
jgi:hypothetical protein